MKYHYIGLQMSLLTHPNSTLASFDEYHEVPDLLRSIRFKLSEPAGYFPLERLVLASMDAIRTYFTQQVSSYNTPELESPIF